MSNNGKIVTPMLHASPLCSAQIKGFGKVASANMNFLEFLERFYKQTHFECSDEVYGT